MGHPHTTNTTQTHTRALLPAGSKSAWPRGPTGKPSAPTAGQGRMQQEPAISQEQAGTHNGGRDWASDAVQTTPAPQRLCNEPASRRRGRAGRQQPKAQASKQCAARCYSEAPTPCWLAYNIKQCAAPAAAAKLPLHAGWPHPRVELAEARGHKGAVAVAHHARSAVAPRRQRVRHGVRSVVHAARLPAQAQRHVGHLGGVGEVGAEFMGGNIPSSLARAVSWWIKVAAGA